MADLHLRRGDVAAAVRVRWPASSHRLPPAIVFLPDAGLADGLDPADEALCDELCANVCAVVLCTPWARRDGLPGSAHERASAPLEWVADHAFELGADPSRLVIAGRGAGAAAAASLAVRAQEDKWPPLVRQLLVVADAGGCSAVTSTVPAPPASRLGRMAPATVVSVGLRPIGEPARRCVERLRAAGAEVDEVPRAGLAASLRRRLWVPAPSSAARSDSAQPSTELSSAADSFSSSSKGRRCDSAPPRRNATAVHAARGVASEHTPKTGNP